MFQDKMASRTAAGRPFSPLVPPALASINLAYLKEIDLLQSRQADAREKKQQGVKRRTIHPLLQRGISKEAQSPHGGLSKPTIELELEFNGEADEPPAAWPGDPGRDLRS